MTTMNFNDLESLRKNGFIGFKSIAELTADGSGIPREKGVYMIVRNKKTAAVFIPVGTGGYFKNENPNVPITQLQSEWVDDVIVVYIGKAGGEEAKATLQKRLKQYMKFGQGKKVGHKGGRYIWQLEDSKDLIVCWKVLPDNEPREVERELITEFKRQNTGRRPFANLLG